MLKLGRKLSKVINECGVQQEAEVGDSDTGTSVPNLAAPAKLS